MNVFKKETLYLGFGDLFDEHEDHDYSILTDEKVFLNSAIHSATIEVDEKGTVATAATAFTVNLLSLTVPTEFTANRPFLYFIRQGQTILFVGRYVSP